MKTLLAAASILLLSAFALPAADGPKNVSVAEAEKLITATENLVVLDVRTPEEFADGHLAKATNINFYASNFSQQLAALPKDKEYLVYCAVGGRSSKAAKLMTQQGLKQVYNLEGGFKAWQKAGKPSVK